LILAQGFMFVSAHQLRLFYGPIVDFGGTSTPVVVDVVAALLGAFLGAVLARLFRRGR
jgi:glycopeptide antibiotics resistance protein